METCIYSCDNGDYSRHNVDLVDGPANSDRRFDVFDDPRHGLQGQSRTDYDHDGGQYKDERRAPEHEYVPPRMEQRSFGAKDEAEDTRKGVGKQGDSQLYPD